MPNVFEGGYFSISDWDEKGGTIYYLLRSGQMSIPHRLKVPEVWHFYEGSDLDLWVLLGEKAERIVLNSENRHFLVPENTWMVAYPVQKSYSFLSTCVYGNFDFEDVEYSSLEKKFPILIKNEL